jgi:hypothetical protein
MEIRIQLVAVVASGLLLLLVLDLVRRRRLLERYALLWLFSALVLLGLSVWRGLLEDLANVIGVAYPPNALFLIAFGFIMILLLHFSIAVSRLADQSKVLAQRVALLEERQRDHESRAELARDDETSAAERNAVLERSAGR